MSASTNTDQRFRFADPRDIDEFIAMTERFERGEISAEAFRSYRLLRGVYGQRQDDVFMLRVKVPQGVLHTDALTALGEVALRSPRKLGHVTTRQNLQFHFIELSHMEGLMRLLEPAGLTTRAACGNSVRNVTGDPRAGLSLTEAFDATPFGDAVVRYLLRHPLSETLPRKFKIAVSGDPTDPIGCAINDIGLVGHLADDGERSFRVLAGGGLSTVPTNAFVLHARYPAARICEVVEALVRVFDRTGDRKNRHKARMKFVVRKMGQEQFVALYQEVLAEVLRAPPPQIDVPPELPRPTHDDAWPLLVPSDPELLGFVKTNVERTREPGRVFVTVRLPLGDITAAQFFGLAKLAERFGDGTIRTTVDQNLLFRGVDVDTLVDLHAELRALGLARPGANSAADVTSCPGADSCKLAITHSRALAGFLTDRLDTNAETGVSLRISGCPNSCGGHQIATIGLHGAVRRIGDKAAPHYNVMVGGRIDGTGATFGRVLGKIPARRVDEAISRLFAFAKEQRAPDESLRRVLERIPADELRRVISDLFELTPNDVVPDDYVDYGGEAPFEVITMEGECAA